MNTLKIIINFMDDFCLFLSSILNFSIYSLKMEIYKFGFLTIQIVLIQIDFVIKIEIVYNFQKNTC